MTARRVASGLWLAFAAPAVISLAAIPVATPVAAQTASPYAAFAAEEATLRHALAGALAGAGEKSEAARALASFYQQRGLHAEALTALAEIEPAAYDEAARRMVARAQYALRRFDEAAATLENGGRALEGEAAALYAMALARLGAFDKAAAAFEGATPPPVLRGEFHLLRAAALLEGGDAEAARAALQMAGPLQPGSSLRAEAAYLAASIDAADGDREAARSVWKSLAERDDAVGVRANLRLIENDVAVGRMSAAAALAQARPIALRWRGAETERAALRLAGALKGDAPEGFAALAMLIERHPQADAARAARVQLAEMMARLATTQNGLSDAARARLFYDMIDYAPPGAQGDALIRDVAERLRALDLLAEAAELLEHQVFKRLRGEARANVGADLADLYLADRRPADALRVIASTRIAGLDADADRRRLHIEAAALLRAGEAEAALALLEGAAGASAARLRGDAFWSQRAWAEAAGAYRAALDGAAAPFDAPARETVLRAASAYSLAGDREGLAALRTAIVGKVGEAEAGRLLETLSDELDAASAMQAYRRALSASTGS